MDASIFDEPPEQHQMIVYTYWGCFFRQGVEGDITGDIAFLKNYLKLRGGSHINKSSYVTSPLPTVQVL